MDHFGRSEAGAVAEDLARVVDILLCALQKLETEGIDPGCMTHQSLVDRCRKG